MKAQGNNDPFTTQFRRRVHFVTALFAIAAVVLVARAAQLQLVESEFLERQGDARHLRVTRVAAHRGIITDRHGELLAVSTPVDSIWANPGELVQAPERLGELATALGRDRAWLMRRVTGNTGREYLYLRRHLPPDRAADILALGIPGVYTEREYRRYYPAGEMAGHVIGFVNIDDEGQEGLELAFDHWLKGVPGAKRVMRDRLGRVIEDVENIATPQPGRELRTSLDLRIQYLAYRALKSAVLHHRARSGAVVVLDVRTGEVLAMVNQPGYNPNNRAQYVAARYRNRAATDIFEPGSSIKPLIVASALESGYFNARSIIDTSPGWFTVGPKTIQDKRNHGPIDFATVLRVSSNVGASRIALELEGPQLWSTLTAMGIGRLTGSGFPGESRGLLNDPDNWRPVGQAILAYGYGVSTTAVQLARAYAAFGADGEMRPVSLLALDEPPPGDPVMSPATARAVVDMMETVVAPGGTAERARVDGYLVAGKTGTAYKAAAGGYSDDRYTSVFAGVAPATRPRLAIVVVVDEPGGEEHYGGLVAAPVFADVAGGALRIMGIAPDDPEVRTPRGLLVQAGRELPTGAP